MRAALLAVFCALCADARAQDAAPAIAETEAAPDPAVTEMDAVRVVGIRPPADPFAFRNPVELDDNRFRRDWDESPSLEEVGLRGGYVQIGINKGLELAAKSIRTLPGWRNQVRAAEARPPPLDAEQAARALRMQQGPDTQAP